MSNRITTRLSAAAAAVLGLLILGSTALAAPDSFGTGTGISNAYNAPIGSTTSAINNYSTITRRCPPTSPAARRRCRLRRLLRSPTAASR